MDQHLNGLQQGLVAKRGKMFSRLFEYLSNLTQKYWFELSPTKKVIKERAPE